MTRKELLSLIHTYPEPFSYPAEQSIEEKKAKFLALLSKHEDAFLRSKLDSHITCSAWLLSPDLNAVVMTHHLKLKKWIQLGGHADGQENVIEVARKEAIEESGVSNFELLSPQIFDLEIHHIPSYGEVPEHYHFNTCFAFRAAEQEELTISEESIDLAWVDLNDLEQFTEEENILRMREKTQALKAIRK